MTEGLPLVAIAASVQRERQRAGLSMTELAKRADIAKSTLSQLEAGTGNPSLETMWALATALDVPFAQLLAPSHAPVEVVRAGEGISVAAAGADYVGTLLSASPPGVRRDIYRVVAAKASAQSSAPHAAGTVEHVYLASGTALVGPADEPVRLTAGDFISYPGDQPHVFEPVGGESTAVLVTEQR